MTSKTEDPDKTSYYWRIHYMNVNQQEVRMMRFNPEENWTRFSDRLCKKVNLVSDKAFPLRYTVGTPEQNITVDDDEDYNICYLIMKTIEDSTDPQKGFKLYVKNHSQSNSNSNSNYNNGYYR